MNPLYGKKLGFDAIGSGLWSRLPRHHGSSGWLRSWPSRWGSFWGNLWDNLWVRHEKGCP